MEQTPFGRALRNRRRALDLTQTELAAKCSVKRSFIADVENARCLNLDAVEPVLRTLERLEEEQVHAAEKVARYVENVAKFRAKHPDFDQVVGKVMPGLVPPKGSRQLASWSKTSARALAAGGQLTQIAREMNALEDRNAALEAQISELRSELARQIARVEEQLQSLRKTAAEQGGKILEGAQLSEKVETED